MTPSARIQSSIEVLEQLYGAWQAKKNLPVDALFGDYFRARRYMGSSDRKVISELVYFVLRHGGVLEWHIERANKAVTPKRVVMLAIWFEQKLDFDAMRALFSGEPHAPSPLQEADIAILQRCDEYEILHADMPIAARLNFPDWMEGRLKDAFGEQLEEAMDALNSQAPIDLRCNTLLCKNRSELILALDADGYYGSPTPHSPIGVRLTKRLPAFNTQAFKDGLYEMQDEGSQMVAQLVDAKAGQKVIDFCAGAGGKTLAIAAAMQNKGRLLAWDTSAKRLDQMPKRLARAGVNNVQLHVLRDERDPFLKRHVGSADWVVIDAPCSGSGTWRRNPDLKWRFTLEDLQEVKDVQQRILQSAARLVKPRGKLVYITCSVFLDENITQIKQFLGENPSFRVASPAKIWDKHLHHEPEVGSLFALSPHKDGTDGFFAAVLENNG